MKNLFVGFLGLYMSSGAPESTKETSGGNETANLKMPEVQAPKPQNPVKDGFLNPAQFKEARQDTFRINGVNENMVQLTAAEERKYLQRNVTHSIYRPYHFYAIQKNTPARKVITLLSYDGEYKTDMLRLVYNEQNKLISRQIVAYSATDGQVMNEAHGWFKTPTTFCFVTIKSEPIRETEEQTEYVLDSTVTHYAVRNEQFAVEKKKTYQRRWVGSSSE